MSTQSENLDTSFEMLVDVSPAEVAAGGKLALRCAVRFDPARDLRGSSVDVYDDAGGPVGKLTFTARDGAICTTDTLAITAPATLGQHDWRAVLTGQKAGPDAEFSQRFTFDVVPHKTGLLVWGAPAAIAVGSEFSVKLGLKCTAGCSMAGRKVEIVDAQGKLVASARMRRATLPGSSGLHQAEVTLRAPAEISRQVWEARFKGDRRALPHTPGAANFGLNFVAAPEHRVTVAVLDAATRAPIRGASVVMHPFRATTGDDGIATLMVCAGDYAIKVSAARHDPVSLTATIAQDHAATAELSPEQEEDPDAMYY